MDALTTMAIVQGIYFLITGAWSLVHIGSFQKVTGRKTDLWLVKAIGSLIMSIGLGLIYSGITYELSPGLIIIAMASSYCLLIIDLAYVLKRVISPVYLGDAVVEFGLVAGWALCLISA
jgi:hypothetical protein